MHLKWLKPQFLLVQVKVILKVKNQRTKVTGKVRVVDREMEAAVQRQIFGKSYWSWKIEYILPRKQLPKADQWLYKFAAGYFQFCDRNLLVRGRVDQSNLMQYVGHVKPVVNMIFNKI